MVEGEYADPLLYFLTLELLGLSLRFGSLCKEDIRGVSQVSQCLKNLHSVKETEES